jgi:hypothetical protein
MKVVMTKVLSTSGGFLGGFGSEKFDNVGWHGKLCPSAACEDSPGREAEEVVASLCIAQWAKSDSVDGPRKMNIIRWRRFLMNLTIRSKRYPQMYLVTEDLTRHHSFRADRIGYSSLCWEKVQ